jgi:CubicO group peptidase (beta-lactamase class C family)
MAAWLMAGAYGTGIRIDPAKDIVGIVLTQMLVAQAHPFIKEVEEAVAAPGR